MGEVLKLGRVPLEYLNTQFYRYFTIPSGVREPPPIISTYIQRTPNTEAVDNILTTRDVILQLLKISLLKTRKQMKNQADIHQREKRLKKGIGCISN